MLSSFAVITVLLLRTRKKCGVYSGAYKSTTQQQPETTAEVHVCKLPSTHAYKFDVQLSVSLQLFHSIGRATVIPLNWPGKSARGKRSKTGFIYLRSLRYLGTVLVAYGTLLVLKYRSPGQKLGTFSASLRQITFRCISNPTHATIRRKHTQKRGALQTTYSTSSTENRSCLPTAL